MHSTNTLKQVTITHPQLQMSTAGP